MAEMRKTTPALCRKCIHSTNASIVGAIPICNYLLDTGKRRGCPLGVCDKFEQGRRRKKVAKS